MELLIFLATILIPACASSSPVFLMMYSSYKLNKQDDNIKRQKDRTLKDERPRSVGAQYATEDHWRNNSRKNEEIEPKQKQHPIVDRTGDRSKVGSVKKKKKKMHRNLEC